MLWAWGAGNHGQLLIGQDDHSLPIAVDPKGRVEKLVGGGAHSLIVCPILLIYKSQEVANTLTNASVRVGGRR